LFIWGITLFFRNKIAFIGLITFLLIILFITMIFNWYWTGTGEFSQRHFFPSITDDFNEFKDYSVNSH